jgi:hypothetical protein
MDKDDKNPPFSDFFFLESFLCVCRRQDVCRDGYG